MKIFKSKTFLDKIIYFNFENQYYLTSTLMRIQEFYESPFADIKNKFFIREKFMDIYAENNKNKFTYFTDWKGFNIPDYIIQSFYDIFKYDLSHKENMFLNEIFKYNKEKYYVIASYNCKIKKKIIEHEICHALYYLNKDYRKKVNAIIKKLNHYDIIKNKLKNRGYGDNTINDEINAYLSTNKNEIKNIFTGVYINSDIIDEFASNFNDFFRKDIEKFDF